MRTPNHGIKYAYKPIKQDCSRLLALTLSFFVRDTDLISDQTDFDKKFQYIKRKLREAETNYENTLYFNNSTDHLISLIPEVDPELKRKHQLRKCTLEQKQAATLKELQNKLTPGNHFIVRHGTRFIAVGNIQGQYYYYDSFASYFELTDNLTNALTTIPDSASLEIEAFTVNNLRSEKVTTLETPLTAPDLVYYGDKVHTKRYPNGVEIVNRKPNEETTSSDSASRENSEDNTCQLFVVQNTKNILLQAYFPNQELRDEFNTALEQKEKIKNELQAYLNHSWKTWRKSIFCLAPIAHNKVRFVEAQLRQLDTLYSKNELNEFLQKLESDHHQRFANKKWAYNLRWKFRSNKWNEDNHSQLGQSIQRVKNVRTTK